MSKGTTFSRSSNYTYVINELVALRTLLRGMVYSYSVDYGPDLRRVSSEMHRTYQKLYEKFYWDDYEKKVVTDHLGSITALIDESDYTYIARYDAWGNREIVIPYWFDLTFDRGYTGHEHLEMLGLIKTQKNRFPVTMQVPTHIVIIYGLFNNQL